VRQVRPKEQLVGGAARAFLSGQTKTLVEAFEELLNVYPDRMVVLTVGNTRDGFRAVAKLYWESPAWGTNGGQVQVVRYEAWSDDSPLGAVTEAVANIRERVKYDKEKEVARERQEEEMV
jgi:hypothetical protein